MPPRYHPRHSSWTAFVDAVPAAPAHARPRARRSAALSWTVLILTAAMTGLALMASDRAATGAGPLATAESGRLQTAVVPAPVIATPPVPVPAAGSPATGPLAGPAGLCLDARSVQLRRCTGTATQSWTAPADGTLRTSDRCLRAIASRLGLVRCTGADSQQWDTTRGTLVARSSRLCLTAGGPQPYLSRCTGAKNQRWQSP